MAWYGCKVIYFNQCRAPINATFGQPVQNLCRLLTLICVIDGKLSDITVKQNASVRVKFISCGLVVNYGGQLAF